MAYKFSNAGAAISLSPRDSFNEFSQYVISQDFANSTSYFIIQEEYPYKSGAYRNMGVRINTAINTATGDKLGDDFKLILFEYSDHPVGIGYMYQFNNNHWITINSEINRSVTVRRCNHTLRWMDSAGVIKEIPVVIDYPIRENRNYATAGSTHVMPSGFIEVTTQFNSLSNTIKQNQRFLIGNPGNWSAYRVLGGGINNFNLQKTSDKNSAGLIKFSMEYDLINEVTDDLVNGICDIGINQYSIEILSNNESAVIAGNPSTTSQLDYRVFFNGEQVSGKTVTWRTSNTAVATINATTGFITFVAPGECNVIATMVGNSFVTGTRGVQVGLAPLQNYQILITPGDNTILEGGSQDYTAALYNNGVLSDSLVVFSVDSSNTVPASYFALTDFGNSSFRVVNYKKYLDTSLKIRCLSEGVHERVYEIWMKGAW